MIATRRTCATLAALLVLSGLASAASPVGTAFTYQGRLEDGGKPTSGFYDFTFELYDDPNAGSMVGFPIQLPMQQVYCGLFSATLDFGDVFDGTALWLQIQVRKTGGGDYQILKPRQPLTTTPFAAFALGVGSHTHDGYWMLGGNAVAETGVLGTLTPFPLNIIVNAARVFRLEFKPPMKSPNVIGGHGDNAVTEGSHGATIAGGGEGGFGHMVTGSYGTIGGGRSNTAGSMATVAGGIANKATGDRAFVGGGTENEASGYGAAVLGGDNNVASGQYSTVAGGARNTASGQSSAVPGGEDNEATGHASLGAGNQAKALHDGAFVWGDSYGADVTSSAKDQWTVRARGGVRVFTNSALTSGVRLDPSGSQWLQASDRSLKENFVDLDCREVLRRLARLSIQSWNYKSQGPAIRHIGPMAQDFYGTFGVGESDRHIGTLDADGVAFGAIQGLYQVVQEKDARLAEFESRIAALEAKVEELVTPKMIFDPADNGGAR